MCQKAERVDGRCHPRRTEPQKNPTVKGQNHLGTLAFLISPLHTSLGIPLPRFTLQTLFLGVSYQQRAADLVIIQREGSRGSRGGIFQPR